MMRLKKIACIFVLSAILAVGAGPTSAAQLQGQTTIKPPTGSIVKSIVKTPAAPTGLMASGDKTRVNLKWQNNADNETGYIVERKAGPDGQYTEIGELGPNAAAFTDQDAKPAGKYYYRVRAYLAAAGARHYSVYSNEASATIVPAVQMSAAKKVEHINHAESAAGKKSVPVLPPFQSVTIATELLTVTGPAPFQPVTIATELLTVTGPGQ